MDRSKELDDIKTALVMFMLLYHSASCLGIWKPYLELLFFIHFAFVAMTGIMVGFHYCNEYYSWQITLRLVQRGGKLLAVFLIVNVLFYLGGGFSWSKLQEQFHLVGAVQFLCNPKGSLCAFEILYHIGVFLIAASVCIVPYGWLVGGTIGGY